MFVDVLYLFRCFNFFLTLSFICCMVVFLCVCVFVCGRGESR